jgi:hypothetical protein
MKEIKMRPSRRRRRRILINGTYENGSFFISSGKYFHKKRTRKTGPFLCVNQTKLIALSLLSFLFNGFPSCSTTIGYETNQKKH